MLPLHPPYRSLALVWTALVAFLLVVACDAALESGEPECAAGDRCDDVRGEGRADVRGADGNADTLGELSGVGEDIDEDPAASLFVRFGTTGALGGRARSERGFGYCGLTDIRADDLQGVRWTDTPAPPWGATPVADVAGRCGDDEETKAWRLMNCERMTASLEPLECDMRLVWLGRQHSEDMRTRDYFSHTSPEGRGFAQRMRAQGIAYAFAGENIAWYPDVASASLGWMDSDGHRSNILQANFTHAGVGISAAQRGQNVYLTQLFLRPQ